MHPTLVDAALLPPPNDNGAALGILLVLCLIMTAIGVTL